MIVFSQRVSRVVGGQGRVALLQNNKIVQLKEELPFILSNKAQRPASSLPVAECHCRVVL